MVCEKGFWFIKGKAFRKRRHSPGRKNVPKHQDAIQFRAAGDGTGNSRLRPAICAKAVRLQQAVAGQRRSLRSRGRGSERCGAAAADLAAYACAGARSRNRGRESAGALKAAVWTGVNDATSVGTRLRRVSRLSSS